MDPTNSQIPTPTPIPEPTPISGGTPVDLGASTIQPSPSATGFDAPAVAPTNPVVSPASPVSAPAEPAAAMPVESPAALMNQAMPSASESVPAMEPVGPATQAAGPVPPVISPAAAFQPNAVGIAVTDPIMTAEQPKVVDPIEEELKAPMRAAGPVPGSIGSAVSVPADDMAGSAPVSSAIYNGVSPNKDQNVSFSDPATNRAETTNGLAPEKKKSKKTLVALIIIALLAVAALVVVLVMQLIGDNSSSSSSSPSSSSSSQSESSSSQESESETTTNMSTLSCARNMTNTEVILFNGAVSGTISVSVKFDEDKLDQISLVKSVVYSDSDGAKNEPVETEVHEATAEDLTGASAAIYYLPVNANNQVMDSLDAVRKNYESLDFVCKLL